MKKTMSLCACKLYTKLGLGLDYNIPVFFLIHQSKQKQPYKAVICVHTL